ncbi:DNA end-binding protein Ku [Rhizobiales bacterium GAS113]|nr:DNA end-binding protein Ku [Rhizobiales bacterium GAS113]
MAPRANWKGFLKIGELTCPVALYTAVSTSERIAFHTLNRKTGNRVRRQFVDQETGRLVEPADQVKGYEVGKGDYVLLEPDQIAAAFPVSDKTLDIERFIACGDIDDVYFDRPYYLGPGESVAQKAFGVIRDGMRSEKVAALARTVLFRRVRTLLIRAHDKGMIATLLNFDYEVRSAKEAFGDVPKQKITGEMLDLAKHIIRTKRGKFDPKKFDDRYESALAELVKAKLEGRPIEAPKVPKPTNVVDLMDALRRSAAESPAATRKVSGKKLKNRKSASETKSPPAHAQHRRKAG